MAAQKRSTSTNPLVEADHADNAAEKTEIRHLYKPERERKAWRGHERGLLNLTRKLSEDERLRVYLYAERLAQARIAARLERKRTASREARHG